MRGARRSKLCCEEENVEEVDQVVDSLKGNEMKRMDKMKIEILKVNCDIVLE